jgi:hypothetical protein
MACSSDTGPSLAARRKNGIFNLELFPAHRQALVAYWDLGAEGGICILEVVRVKGVAEQCNTEEEQDGGRTRVSWNR